MVDLGYDLMAVQDFLEEKCIFEENPELVIDYLNNPNYINQLKIQYVPPFNPMAAGPVQYQYKDLSDQSMVSADKFNLQS